LIIRRVDVRNIIVFFTAFLFIILVGCSGDPGITGYVMDKKDQEILIVSTIADDYSENGGTEEHYDAVWAYNAPDEVNVGQKVKVWFKGAVATSYPGLATVGKLEVLPSSTSEGATLSDDEALNKALSQSNFGSEILAVKSISYDSVTDTWTIKLNEHTVEVEDKKIDRMPKAETGIYYGNWINNPFTLIVGSIIVFILLTLLIFTIEKKVKINKSY
jgi:hypothetical protein